VWRRYFGEFVLVDESSVTPSRTLEEQREIVAVLDAIDRKADLPRRKRAVLEGLFTALLVWDA
jgi:hypothetical protein